MSFGIGAFPFGFFASNFNFGEERPGAPGPGSHQALEEAFLHKVFLWVGHLVWPEHDLWGSTIFLARMDGS